MIKRLAGSGLLEGSAHDQPAMAASIMVGSLFLLGFQDALVKLVSSEVSLWQFQMLRATINLMATLALMRLIWGAQASARPKRPGVVALRSLFLICAMCLFFGGVPFLSLAEIAAGLYVYPLFVAMLSALVLGERVGPRRIVAILAGFTGTLLILKPGTEAFKLVGLMPVGAALCYAATILTTRRLCRQESPVTLAMAVAVGYILVGGLMTLVLSLRDPVAPAVHWPYLFTGWHALEPWVFGLIAVCALINMTSNIGLAKAYQSAEATWLVPFDYSYLIFASFWGYVFWRTVPDAPTFLGMALIAFAGTYVAWRDRQAHPSHRANFNRNLR